MKPETISGKREWLERIDAKMYESLHNERWGEVVASLTYKQREHLDVLMNRAVKETEECRLNRGVNNSNLHERRYTQTADRFVVRFAWNQLGLDTDESRDTLELPENLLEAL